MQFINSPRGDTEARISFDDLYRIVREKLNYFHPDRSDPDAFCQDMCVRIEKKMGIYPNVSGPALATTAGEATDAEWQTMCGIICQSASLEIEDCDAVESEAA